MKSVFTYGFLVLCITACATTPPQTSDDANKYSGDASDTSISAIPSNAKNSRVEAINGLVTGKTNLITLNFKRDHGVFDYGGVSAKVEINGEKACELKRVDQCTKQVPGEIVVLSVDAWSAPGAFKIKLNLESGHTYTFRVNKNKRYGSDWRNYFGLLGMAAQAADVSFQETGGPFQLDLIEVINPNGDRITNM